MGVLRVVLSAVALLAILPESGAACPVCFDTTEENRMAFMLTTVLLSLLPLGMVGGVGMWVLKRARRAEEEEGAREA